MDDSKYINYLQKIKHFLSSKKAYPFRAKAYGQTLVKYILKDLKNIKP